MGGNAVLVTNERDRMVSLSRLDHRDCVSLDARIATHSGVDHENVVATLVDGGSRSLRWVLARRTLRRAPERLALRR